MRSSSSSLARWFAVVVVLVAGLSISEPVGAHSDFDYSLPTDGASVGEPVGEVTVAFTSPVTLVGNGFEVLDPQENLLQPFAVTDDDTVFRLQFDPPLAGGAVGVRYTVAAADGHTLSGAFSFVVSVELPPEPTDPPTTTVAATQPQATAPATAAASVPSTEAPAGTTPETAPAAPEAADTVPVEAEATEAATAVTAAELGEVPDDGDDSSNTGLLIGIAVAVAGLAAVFLVFRSRSSSTA